MDLIKLDGFKILECADEKFQIATTFFKFSLISIAHVNIF